MKKVITFEIECGKKTCATSKGKFCEYFGQVNLGIKPWCHLFNEELYDYGNPEGWVKRCDNCIEKAVNLEK